MPRKSDDVAVRYVPDPDNLDNMLAVVPTPSGEPVTLDAAAWRWATALGMSACLHIASNRRKGDPTARRYVRAHARGRRFQLAKLIAGAGQDEGVRYRNGNLLDLRRSNLVRDPNHVCNARHDYTFALELAAGMIDLPF